LTSGIEGEVPSSHDVRWDSGSFRDPAGQIFIFEGRILRAIRSTFAEAWSEFSSSAVFQELQQAGLMIRSAPPRDFRRLPPFIAEGSCAVIEHERIPFVSYPYEWSFGMLKDAALLHLDILEKTLKHDFILKDASAYNVQFRGSTPVFVDVLSFTRLAPGEPWLGYHQFCEMFLCPLMLQSYKQIPFQSWLRSELEGLDVVQFSRLLGVRDLLRPGVLTHIRLQAWMEERLASSRQSIRQKIKTTGFSKSAIANNLRGLRRLLHKLNPQGGSAWTDYVQTRSYTDTAVKQKEEFVRQVLQGRRWRLVWDLGCNIGDFSRLASDHADYVVALDADHHCIERFYQSLRQKGQQNILPLVMNLANLSPDQGWGGRERQSLRARGKPELTLCLALVHHMAITCNVPIPAFLSWLAELGTSVIIEFIAKEDPMVQRLLLNKDDTYGDYNRAAFEQHLARLFRVEKSVALTGGTRFLYFAVPWAGS
jgi:ribosomal protein L11 methylase PrmA